MRERTTCLRLLVAEAIVTVSCGGKASSGGGGAGGATGAAGTTGAGGTTGAAGASGAAGATGAAGTTGAGGAGGGGTCQACAQSTDDCPADVATADSCPSPGRTCCAAGQQWHCGNCAAETCHWSRYCAAASGGNDAGADASADGGVTACAPTSCAATEYCVYSSGGPAPPCYPHLDGGGCPPDTQEGCFGGQSGCGPVPSDAGPQGQCKAIPADCAEQTPCPCFCGRPGSGEQCTASAGNQVSCGYP